MRRRAAVFSADGRDDDSLVYDVSSEAYPGLLDLFRRAYRHLDLAGPSSRSAETIVGFWERAFFISGGQASVRRSWPGRSSHPRAAEPSLPDDPPARLRDGPDHARGIRTQVLERFDSLMGVDPGGLHRLVTRLEALGLIRSSGEDTGGIDDDERGRIYELTHVGRSVLAAEARRLSRLARLPEVAEAAGAASA